MLDINEFVDFQNIEKHVLQYKIWQKLAKVRMFLYSDAILDAIFFFSMDIISPDLDSFRAAAVGVGVW